MPTGTTFVLLLFIYYFWLIISNYMDFYVFYKKSQFGHCVQFKTFDPTLNTLSIIVINAHSP